MAGARCKPCVSTKTQTSGSLCRACTAKNLNSLPAFYQVNVSSMLNSTPKKRAPSHLDPLTTHEPFLFIFYSFLFKLIMLICVISNKLTAFEGPASQQRIFAHLPSNRSGGLLTTDCPLLTWQTHTEKGSITQPILTSDLKNIQSRLSLNQC